MNRIDGMVNFSPESMAGGQAIDEPPAVAGGK